MNWIMDPNIWLALLTLSAIEIVLGVDNIVFIAILAGKLPEHQQAKGRTVGLILAMATRILLLFSISLIMKLTQPLFVVFAFEISGRDIILIAGGLFLLVKSTHEIHNNAMAKREWQKGNICGRGNPDYDPGYCLFNRFRGHGHRSGQAAQRHGCGHHHCCYRNDLSGRKHQFICG